MPKITSHIKKYDRSQAENVFYQDNEQPFGYFEIQNSRYRGEQEDALAWETLENAVDTLTPEEIGKRLWTTYRNLDEQFLQNDCGDGTTAATTIYDGKGNLITALLADAASFAAVYDNNNQLLGVVRLNSVIHKAKVPIEKKRIEDAGGRVYFDRVGGQLAVSRGIGDKYFKEIGVCSEATIDITSINTLAKTFQVSPNAIRKVQIINTCDGFTDGANVQTKKGHEEFLLEALKEISEANDKLPETEIAKALVTKAKEAGSTDNITVAIQTITSNTPALLLGVYDGHGGSEASIYVAENIGEEFRKQCELTSEVYQNQTLSTDKNSVVYNRDHANKQNTEHQKNDLPTTTELNLEVQSSDGLTSKEEKREEKDLPFPQINIQVPNLNDINTKATEQDLDEEINAGVENSDNQEEFGLIINQLAEATKKYQASLSLKNREIHAIIAKLLSTLDNSEKNQNTIKRYFELLNAKEPGKQFTNIEIIQNNKDIPTKRFISGVAIIVATLATGIIPGLAVMGIVYALTGKSLFNLFKTNSELFKSDLAQIKKEHHLQEEPSQGGTLQP
ncbi:Protein phosphatase 2C [Legionella busanensis]|uniref:Protein phosphatase 2C n=1 Tax=Legionella busanensis TaxID=190655 RepID=A0A378JIY6_9GAMM|nr:PP2C family protein-serine/threonine phosphatase [Legionella busanensis]STX50189.1 Protein phosphatase 2C [Legionella busanensis]